MHEQFGDSSTPLRFAQNDRRLRYALLEVTEGYASLGVTKDFI